MATFNLNMEDTQLVGSTVGTCKPSKLCYGIKEPNLSKNTSISIFWKYNIRHVPNLNVAVLIYLDASLQFIHLTKKNKENDQTLCYVDT